MIYGSDTTRRVNISSLFDCRFSFDANVIKHRGGYLSFSLFEFLVYSVLVICVSLCVDTFFILRLKYRAAEQSFNFYDTIKKKVSLRFRCGFYG